jgi:membrane protease YdiL (CAAX protease family)
MRLNFDWNTTKQLKPLEILLAFILPSSFAFVGFRVVLPWLVNNGYPKVIMWGIVASIMLFIFAIVGLLLVSSESRKLNISLKERLLIKKVSTKQWLISLGIMIVGIALAQAVSPFIFNFMELTGLSIPDYMPFWLDPSINPMETDMAILSPNYPMSGNYAIVIVMGIALMLNILVEEIYFRAWLLPKMQSLGKWSWVINGLLFALYHTFQLWLFPMLVIVSLSITLTVYISKSILPAFTIHFIANFLLSIIGIIVLVFG